MIATLLCPGPSLALYSSDKRLGITVGVNRAATLHECDVWAVTDMPLIKHTMPLGTPTLYTIAATRDSLIRRGKAWPYGVVTHDDVGDGKPWTRYTATAALAYLAWSGVSRVEVYGADWSGVLDWDGVSGGCGRSDDRWAEERRIWDATIKRYNLEVIRHGFA